MVSFHHLRQARTQANGFVGRWSSASWASGRFGKNGPWFHDVSVAGHPSWRVNCALGSESINRDWQSGILVDQFSQY
jgi:hypothetical protein